MRLEKQRGDMDIHGAKLMEFEKFLKSREFTCSIQEGGFILANSPASFSKK